MQMGERCWSVLGNSPAFFEINSKLQHMNFYMIYAKMDGHIIPLEIYTIDEILDSIFAKIELCVMKIGIITPYMYE